MVSYTALTEVEEARAAGLRVTFPPALVRIVNFSAPNVGSKRFLYNACSSLDKNGRLCHKSLEFGNRCGHDSLGVLKFRFCVCIADAFHGSILDPLTAQVWEVGTTLLRCKAEEFALQSELDQGLYVSELTQNCPRVRVSLSTKDYFISVQNLSFVHGLPKVRIPVLLGENVGSPSTSTPNKYTANKQSTLKNSEKVRDKEVLAALGTLV